jgi:glutamate-1-semialdehyde 2,1-aminomutase
MISLLLERLLLAKRIDNAIVAIPDNERNQELVGEITKLGFEVYCGDEADVLDRYYTIARSLSIETVVRITGDCPLIDPTIVDATIELFYSTGADYTSNTVPPTFPDGLDVEAFSVRSLEQAWRMAENESQREHVTLFSARSDFYSLQSVPSYRFIR